VGPGAGLDRCGKSRPTGIRSPDRPASSSVAIPTELPGPPNGALTAGNSRCQPLDIAQCLNMYYIRNYRAFRKLPLLLYEGDCFLLDIPDLTPNKNTKIH
jgi:hypothetical protein